jgi:hypothetical protein
MPSGDGVYQDSKEPSMVFWLLVEGDRLFEAELEVVPLLEGKI